MHHPPAPTFRFMSLSYCERHLLNRCRMLVWFASIRPLTRCAVCAYGDFFDSATCHIGHSSSCLACSTGHLVLLRNRKSVSWGGGGEVQ
jgi:hypothetical protein